MRKQIFLSHSWGLDTQHRNNHDRVRILKAELMQLGWTVWFDETDMGMNMDSSMIKGIENSDVFCICLTESYSNKVNQASFDPTQTNNCWKEFNYANMRKKLPIFILFENIEMARNVMSMYLGNRMYIDSANDDMKTVAHKINDMLESQNMKPLRKATMLKNVVYANMLRKRKENGIQAEMKRKLRLRKRSILALPEGRYIRTSIRI